MGLDTIGRALSAIARTACSRAIGEDRIGYDTVGYDRSGAVGRRVYHLLGVG